jgi:hypothetical protein
MKKISFFALMSMFALATPSCDKETEIVDKTEYDVIVLVESYEKNSSGSYDYNDTKSLEGARITLVDYGTTVTTNSDGKATLKLQLGSYRVTVEKNGYRSSSYSDSDDIQTSELEVYGNAFKEFRLYKK